LGCHLTKSIYGLK
jgi:hypothetical protein